MFKGWTNFKRFLKLGLYTPSVIYPTIQNIGGMKSALDVQSHSTMSLIGSDVVDAVHTMKVKEDGSTVTYVVAITAAAHGFKRGDIIKFTNGNSVYKEQRIINVGSVNKFYLSEPILSTDLVATNTFNVYRDSKAIVTTSGFFQTVAGSYSVGAGYVLRDLGSVAVPNGLWTTLITLTRGIAKLDITNNSGFNFMLANNGTQVGFIPKGYVGLVEFTGLIGQTIDVQSNAGSANAGELTINTIG